MTVIFSWQSRKYMCNDSKIFMHFRIRHDTYTCHCEKIEDFRGNPEKYMCNDSNIFVAIQKYMCSCGLLRRLRLLVMTKPMDYFVTAFLVMTVRFLCTSVFVMTHTLVIARKSKIFVAIQKVHVWLWITSSLCSS